MPPLPSPAPPPDACHLYLLRHGATANNVAHPPRIQGRGSDSELSADGRRQAEEAAERLRGVALAAVYASTMRRAIETAERIALPHGLAVTPLPQLIECDVGIWEGRTWSEVERDDAEYYAKFRADPATHGYLGGENLMHVLARVAPTFDRLLAEHVGQSIAVVAHNVVNRAYLAHVLGVPLADARERVPQHNGAITLLRHSVNKTQPAKTQSAKTQSAKTQSAKTRSAKTQVVMLNAIWHLSQWE